jgi:hypothetical protein
MNYKLMRGRCSMEDYNYGISCEDCGHDIDCDFNMYPVIDSDGEVKAVCFECYHINYKK